MGELYLRKVILEIIPQHGLAKKIDGLRIKFKIEKTNEAHPNNSDIEIYNLAEATRSLVEAKNTKVRLSIGYEGLKPSGVAGTGIGSSSNVEVVFVGDISKALHKKKSKEAGYKSLNGVSSKQEGADIITKIQAADGENKYRNARLDKGYPPDTKLKDVFNDILDSIGLAKGPQEGIPDVNYANGLTLSGLARDHMTTLAQAQKLEWSIQDETVQIIPQGKGTTESIIFLDASSGLVNIPCKTDKGVEFDSLIQPKLRPGRRVQLKSKFIEGIFKIRKVTHEGDSNKGNFISKVEASK